MNTKIIALLLVCVMLASAGCTAYSGSQGSSAKALEAGYPGDSSGSWNDARIAYAGAAAPVPAPTMAPKMDSSTGPDQIETKIIRTAYLTIEVSDVTASAEALKAMAAVKGGYLSSTSIQKGYNDRLSGTVVMRIPQAEFDNTLAGIKAIGSVKSSSTQGEDVTEEYVDLQALKTSYQNQLAQYNEIMKKAVKVSDVIEIQSQIDRVQTELNRLEGRIKYLNSRVDFSTITVNLQEPEPVGGETGHNFVTTLNEGIAGFIGMVDALIILFFTLLPLAILIGIIYAAYRWNKGRKPATPASPEEKK